MSHAVLETIPLHTASVGASKGPYVGGEDGVYRMAGTSGEKIASSGYPVSSPAPSRR